MESNSTSGGCSMSLGNAAGLTRRHYRELLHEYGLKGGPVDDAD